MAQQRKRASSSSRSRANGSAPRRNGSDPAKDRQDDAGEATGPKDALVIPIARDDQGGAQIVVVPQGDVRLTEVPELLRLAAEWWEARTHPTRST